MSLCQVKSLAGCMRIMKGRRMAHILFFELSSWHQYKYLKDSLMIYHFKNKCEPFTLLSAVNAWKFAGPETDNKFEITINVSGSLVSIISEVAEGVSSQLHYRILKSARRVILDEIISSVISEFVTTTKAQRLKQDVKTYPSDVKMVMFTIEKMNMLICEFKL